MRTNFRIAAAATTTLVAALTLTACGSGTNSEAGDKPAASASASGPATGDPAGAGQDSGSGSAGSGTGSGSSAGSGAGKHSTGTPAKSTGKSTKKPASGGAGGGGGTDAPCTGANVKLTATPVSRPINHILLTATNTGKTPCNAYDAPAVSFSNAQSPIAVDKDTIPQAVVSLAPGASAYAMVRTLGEDDGTPSYQAGQVVVFFRGKAGMESTGRSAYAVLSKGVSVVDAQAMSTYWQSDLSAIDSW
ncbi:DUF4232 domain-containing protein [Streptomyces sp. ASQP_92]|uniref:DUF4232 domain-containing protein n=1 Tax=Streptomyces sp. ASQP_92 TaxID=2979116 RepID=UPI0021BE6EC8|nr:DUF4232 domain-containing protein [Streptomyces sp. ASQP_92]MCT9094137.1 DUF4232 domain-containing protein [Streptomyces sp. ASQP_92]